MKHLKILVLAMLVCGMAACKHDDLTVTVPNENIRPATDFIKNNYEMTLFSAALKKTGLAEQLNGAGPFTVLVPNDLAFNELGIFRPSDFDKMNVDSLKKVISYHIMPRKLMLADIPTDGVDVRYPTLEGSELYTTLGSGQYKENKLFFSGAYTTRKDVILSNGVLHVIEKMMKPNFKVTTQQWLEKRAEYSVFIEGLKKFGLWEQLAQAGPCTVFAPSNEALASIGITSASLAALNKDNYNGDLLFGAYLMYNRHFFISDSEALRIISGRGDYSYYLKDNKHYMQFSVLMAYPQNLYYRLMVKPSNELFATPIKSVEYYVQSKMDNLCSNGVIHHLESGLLTPQQSIKK